LKEYQNNIENAWNHIFESQVILDKEGYPIDRDDQIDSKRL
jgi:hypothetical protein